MFRGNKLLIMRTDILKSKGMTERADNGLSCAGERPEGLLSEMG